jgi:TRAP-type C4-dicarboxylate transport system substrate-binding protein
VANAIDTLKKNGMQVSTFNTTELAKLRDKLRPVTAKYGVTVGQELVKELQADLEKARSGGKKK